MVDACCLSSYAGYGNAWLAAARAAQARLRRAVVDVPHIERSWQATALAPTWMQNPSEDGREGTWMQAMSLLGCSEPDLAAAVGPGELAAAAPRCASERAANRRAAAAARQLLDPGRALSQSGEPSSSVVGAGCCPGESNDVHEVQALPGADAAAEQLPGLKALTIAHLTAPLSRATVSSCIMWPACIDAPVLARMDEFSSMQQRPGAPCASVRPDVQDSSAAVNSLSLLHLKVWISA